MSLTDEQRRTLGALADTYVAAVPAPDGADPTGFYARTGSQNNPLVPVDSGAAFDEALSHLEQLILEHGAAVTRGPLPEVLADPGQLALLFQNLIDNGIKFRRGERPAIGSH